MACLLLAAAILGAAPPAVPTPGQQELLARRGELWDEAHAAWKEGEHAEAVASMRKALVLADRVHGRDSWLAFAHSAWLATWAQARGRWREEAEQRERMWLAMAALHGAGERRAVDARWGMRTARLRQGWGREENALWDLATRRNAEVVRLWQQGKSREALAVAAHALRIRLSLAGRAHPAVAHSLFNVGAQYEALGDGESALPWFRRAVALHEEVFGVRHQAYASCLNALAGLYQDMGDYKAALPLYRRSVTLRREVLGEGHPSHAESLSNLAMLLHEMGDHRAALGLLRRQLALTARGGKDDDAATDMNNLALVYKALGDHKAALATYKKSLALIEAGPGRGHADYATGLNNLALLHHAMGDLDAALTLSRQALTLQGRARGKRHPLYATGLNNLGVLLHAKGGHEEALTHFKQALGLREEGLGGGHPSTARTLNNLAMLHKDMDAHAAALSAAERALAIITGHVRADAAVLSDRQQLAAASDLRAYLDNRLLLRDDARHTTAAEHVLNWKGALLLRQQRRRLFLRLSDAPEARAAAARLDDVTRRLVALRASPSATRARLEALREEQDDAQAALSGLSAAFREAREMERVTPEALARALPEGVALVDYLFHGGRLSAFVHRKGAATARVELGRAAPVEQAIREWRPLLIRGKDGLRVGAVLKRLVWLPLEKHLGGTKVVLISPDGALGAAPFAALPGAKSGAYLIEDVAVAVVPVPRAIPDLLRAVAGKDRHPPSLLAVGGVDYDAKASPAAAAGARSAPAGVGREWGALPGTAAEADAAGEAFALAYRGGTLVRLAGAKATKAAVRGALTRARYAHLATHGFFAPEAVRSALDAAKKRDPLRPEPATGWHPLLLSGLALSGANREPKEGEEDGILTALEVSEMDLTRLELVVLSACETGLGAAAEGEGLLGLQRAFAAAGARSAVASLWGVDDRATRVLMGDFYTLVWDAKAPVARAEALRRAQMAILSGRTLDGKPRGLGKTPDKPEKGATRLPPYYWAAFVLSGDWR